MTNKHSERIDNHTSIDLIDYGKGFRLYLSKLNSEGKVIKQIALPFEKDVLMSAMKTSYKELESLDNHTSDEEEESVDLLGSLGNAERIIDLRSKGITTKNGEPV